MKAPFIFVIFCFGLGLGIITHELLNNRINTPFSAILIGGDTVVYAPKLAGLPQTFEELIRKFAPVPKTRESIPADHESTPSASVLPPDNAAMPAVASGMSDAPGNNGPQSGGQTDTTYTASPSPVKTDAAGPFGSVRNFYADKIEKLLDPKQDDSSDDRTVTVGVR